MRTSQPVSDSWARPGGRFELCQKDFAVAPLGGNRIWETQLRFGTRMNVTTTAHPVLKRTDVDVCDIVRCQLVILHNLADGVDARMRAMARGTRFDRTTIDAPKFALGRCQALWIASPPVCPV